ncbi:MAG: hypothetical protein ACK46Q_12715 [Hyphomonas sp.]
MALMTRIFGNRKASVVGTERFHKATMPVEDRPRQVRSQVYREASVVYESGYTRKGIVLDYSDRGVRLRFSTNEGLPRLLMLNARSVGVQGRAEVVWQKGSEVGLKLLG